MDKTARLDLYLRRFEFEHERKDSIDGSLTAPFTAYSFLIAAQLLLLKEILGDGSWDTHWLTTVVFAFASACMLAVAIMFLFTFWGNRYSFVDLPSVLESWLQARRSWQAAQVAYREKYAGQIGPQMALEAPEEAFDSMLIRITGKHTAACFEANRRRLLWRFRGVLWMVISYAFMFAGFALHWAL